MIGRFFMKKYITISLLLFVPFMSMAADHCTNPKEYTVDKRCYVTDEQKKEKPYNAVVALIDNVDPYCTGTIVKGENGKPYLYTARHCTEDKDEAVKPSLQIKLQDGRKLEVTKNNVGNYDIAENKNFAGDWAIYSIKQSNIPMVEKTTKIKIGLAPYEIPYDAKVVGYGSLEIMSDKEISEFRNEYIKYLQDKKNVEVQGTEESYGFRDDGGIYYYNAYVQDFVYSNTAYLKTSDYKKLKVSVCKYLSTGREKGCQTWGGNSGGPIFDSDNKIMGIHTRGNSIIGGKHHANKETWWTAPRNDSVNLLK